ncbi:DUF397 domain-containing protein [Nocardiopsis protaetiae]|uniref:DUF397 domain-containing protein n=1 Tax=Nocardiopsis protaetiae TaxID=3382270 RepID=UPI00387B1A76
MNTWHKSTYSYDVGACVEVSTGEETRIRDTQHREQGHLGFRAGEWAAAVKAIRGQR